MSDNVRPMTRGLYEAFVFGDQPSLPAIVDFGIDTPDHYRALALGVLSDQITPQQLDAALGNGIELTKLARGVEGTPYTDVIFCTSWDELHGRDPHAFFEAEAREPEQEK